MRAIAIAFVFALVLLSTAALADVPGLINYQGTLTDGDGVALDTTVSMTFSIYTDSTGGSTIWTETQSSVQVIAGIFNILLGSVNSIADTVFGDPERWLGVQVGGDAELTPRQRIAAVGYAFKAKSNGGWSDDGTVVRLTTATDSVGIGTASPSATLDVRGPTVWGLWAGSDRMKLNWNSPEQWTHFGADTAYDLRLLAGGEQHVTIKTNGNVGMGTTSPIEKLQIVGTDARLLIQGGGSNNGMAINFTGASGRRYDILSTGASDPIAAGKLKIRDVTGGTDVFIIESGSVGIRKRPANELSVDGDADFSGNVGIGTTSPQRHLHIAGDAASYIRVDHATQDDWTIGAEGTGFIVYNVTDSAYRLVVDNTGNVGIGTESPGAKLHVVGSSGHYGRLGSSNSGVYGYSNSNDAVIGDSPSGKGVYGFSGGSGTGVWGSSNSGVGVRGSSTTGYAGYFTSDVYMTGFEMPTGASNGYVLTSDASGVGTWQPSGAAGAYGDWTISGSNMHSAPSGNVGIGTENPARKLHVNDVMRLEPRDTAPTSPSMGDMYIRSSDGKLMVYDGATWQACW